MYRMTKQAPLQTGQKYGDIIRDGELSPGTIQALLARAILVRVSTPPLSELSECWEKRARKLNKAGIVTVEDLAQANVNKTAKVVSLSPRTIRRWQQEAIDYLNPKKPKKGK